MGPHSAEAGRGGQRGDLAEFFGGEDLEGVADVVGAIGGGHCFVLRCEDPLRDSLLEACRGVGRGRIVDVLAPRSGRDGEGAKREPGHEYKIAVVVGGKKGGGPVARLARRTRVQIGLEPPERRPGMLNLGLGVAVFAVMSVTSLAILAPPYSFAIAAGALAPAGIMLARAARRNA